MLIAAEDKTDMLIRLDNIRTLKILQQYGYGLIEHNWTPNYPSSPQYIDHNIFFSALKRIFGKENIEVFFIETNRPEERRIVKAQIKEFIGCNFRFQGSNIRDYFTIIAIKSEHVNSSKRWIKYALNKEEENIPDINDYAIFPVKTGFLIMLSELYSYSQIIKNIIGILEKMKLVEKKEIAKSAKKDPPEVRITLRPHTAYVEIADDGLKSEKRLHPLELVRAIAQHSAIPDKFKIPDPTMVTAGTGILPHSHTSISTLFVYNTIKTEYEPAYDEVFTYQPKPEVVSASVGVLIPAGKYLYNYYGEIYSVAFPQMLFIYETQKDGECYKITNCKIFSLKKGPVNIDTKVYCFPFANVDDNGNICFGQNRLPFIKSLSELETFFAFILGMESNNDLYKGEISQRELVETFSAEDVFDESLLKDYGTMKELL